MNKWELVTLLDLGSSTQQERQV